MVKKIFLLAVFSCLTFLLSISKPVYAVVLQLTPEDINEAIEYGQKNKRMGLAEFSRPWSVALGKGEGFSTLFTPFHNLAYHARKSAIERKEFTQREAIQALEIGNILSFSITVYDDNYQFAKFMSANLCQNDLLVQPSFEYTPEFSEASEFWPNSPSQLARLVFKFPADEIDLNSPVSLVIVAPRGREIPFVFDLSKMK